MFFLDTAPGSSGESFHRLQHQEMHPGVEAEMKPKPIFITDAYKVRGYQALRGKKGNKEGER